MSNLNDIINYGTAKFKVVRNVTSENMGNFSYVPVPLGSIIPYSVNSLTPPKGFLFCDGSEISRTTYNDLFNVIGTTYGYGDEETTFNLPNLTSGEFLESGLTAGTKHTAGLPNIIGTHTGIVGDFQTGTGAIQVTHVKNGYATGGGQIFDLSFDASKSNSIYGNSTTVQPKSLTVKYIIKAFNPLIDDDLFVDANELNNTLNKKFDVTKDFTIIYPNNGTASNPANVSCNNRYVESNPFPGYYVRCQVEVYQGNEWGVSHYEGYREMATTAVYYGVGIYCYQHNDNSIVLVTGTHLIGQSEHIHDVHPNTFNFPSLSQSVPCRVKVWKIGKI